MLVLGVINAYPVIMDTQIVNLVVVLNKEVHLLFATHQENVLVYLVFPEEHASNVVQDIINFPNANVNLIIISFTRITNEYNHSSNFSL